MAKHGYRNHATQREETSALKKALQKAGINARVGHGRGTAHGWIYVNLGTGSQWSIDRRDVDAERGDEHWMCLSETCQRCRNRAEMERVAWRVIREVTGRSGDHAMVNVRSQDHWNERAKTGEPIEHPDWVDVLEPSVAVGASETEPTVPPAVEPEPSKLSGTRTVAGAIVDALIAVRQIDVSAQSDEQRQAKLDALHNLAFAAQVLGIDSSEF